MPLFPDVQAEEGTQVVVPTVQAEPETVVAVAPRYDPISNHQTCSFCSNKLSLFPGLK